MGTAARIGTALHRTLQSISEQPLPAGSIPEITAEAGYRFEKELKAQRSEIATHPREQALPWDAARASRAAEAVIAEAIRITETGGIPQRFTSTPYHEAHPQPLQKSPFVPTTPLPIEVEIPVQSSDGLFRGRVDRAERTPTGVRLMDYKSALRDDMPERYERQLQLYAFMWYETRGEWPVEAQVFYPLRGAFHSVNIEPALCQQVAVESAQLIGQFSADIPPARLARPGDVCKVCEYRPWCRPFWTWQSAEEKHMLALELAALGFEGVVGTITLTDHYWRIEIVWRPKTLVRLVAPQERFPHLALVAPGARLRILDAPLRGQLYQPTAQVSPYTELFVLAQLAS